MTLLQIDEVATPDVAMAIQEFSTKIGVRLLINIASIFILVRFIYFKINKRSEYFFTYFIFNLVIFLMCFFLNKVKLSMGAAFGLFAVFGMLRYKTEEISIKDMTYLFLVIAIGLLTAVIKIEDVAYYYEFLFIAGINSFILLMTYLLESNILMKKETAKNVIYENIELIKPEKKAELMLDLELRTGLKINRISIGKIDFLRDIAIIKIYYYED